MKVFKLMRWILGLIQVVDVIRIHPLRILTSEHKHQQKHLQMFALIAVSVHQLCRGIPYTMLIINAYITSYRVLFHCSNGSVDISPLMALGKPRKLQRPKAAVNKTVPLNVAPSNLSTSSSSSTLSDAIYVGHHDPGVISPKSYLSMPSVKAFPKYVGCFIMKTNQYFTDM